MPAAGETSRAMYLAAARLKDAGKPYSKQRRSPSSSPPTTR
jgi:hypothetical protein